MADRPTDAGLQERSPTSAATSGPAIRAACAQFVDAVPPVQPFPTRTIVAIPDGSKFKAVNNRDKNFTVAKVAKRIEQVEASRPSSIRSARSRHGWAAPTS